MPPRLQINLLFDGRLVELWRYIPEQDHWLDQGGAVPIPNDEVVKQDVVAAVEHFLSIIKGTHP